MTSCTLEPESLGKERDLLLRGWRCGDNSLATESEVNGEINRIERLMRTERSEVGDLNRRELVLRWNNN